MFHKSIPVEKDQEKKKKAQCYELVICSFKEESSDGYCLIYTAFVQCPVRCPYRKEGTPRTYSQLLETNLEPFCSSLEFNQLPGENKLVGFCKKENELEPDCLICTNPKYERLLLMNNELDFKL